MICGWFLPEGEITAIFPGRGEGFTKRTVVRVSELVEIGARFHRRRMPRTLVKKLERMI